MITLAVSIQYISVTDRSTDGRTDRHRTTAGIALRTASRGKKNQLFCIKNAMTSSRSSLITNAYTYASHEDFRVEKSVAFSHVCAVTFPCFSV